MATLMNASHQWAVRPADERFEGGEIGPVTRLFNATQRHHLASKEVTYANRDLSAHPVEGDDKGLVLMNPEHQPAAFSNWSFGQFAARAGAPASYLRDLPTPLAADCLNYGLHHNRDVDALKLLVRAGVQIPEVMAATGPGYGRIPNFKIAKAILDRFGDGQAGDFRVPGEFGKRVEITKANTTVFASDRDMFVFLADEERRIEISDRRDGKSGALARGFFISNSEVGAGTLSIHTFLFDYVCCNRIVWGAQDVKQINIRHTKGAPWRFVEEVAPALEEYAASSAKTTIETIKNAKQRMLGDKAKVQEFLANRFTRSQAVAINLAHEEEEGRPIATLWDAVTGATAYARGITYQNERVDLERQAGKMLDLVAA